MLPQITLDDERFDDIVENARKQIAGLCPEWTDYNYHDPGITMLELFAWLKEMQQFHLDQIGAAHELKYLELLGMKPRDVHPAKTRLKLDGVEAPQWIPAGSRAFAGDICFETTRGGFYSGAEVETVVSIARDKKSKAVRSEAQTGKRLHFPAFGKYPREGNELRLGLCGALIPGRRYRLGFYFDSKAAGRRNPIGKNREFTPLAELALSYYKGAEWRGAEILEDGTHQLLEDGFLEFSVPGTMERGEGGLYWLCFTLLRSEYDMPPVIEDVSLRQAEVRQQYTVSELFEGVLAGEPVLEASTWLACRGGYLLFVKEQDGYRLYEGESRRELKQDGAVFYFPGLGSEREPKTCRLICYDTGCEDRILIEAETGDVFQSCEKVFPDICADELFVMAETTAGGGCYQDYPVDRETSEKKPEGKLLLAQARLIRGAAGNVRAGTINRLGEARPGIRICNDRDAAGGAERETIAACFGRLRRGMSAVSRAVTYRDIETLAKQTPGLMIENVRAIPVTERKRQDQTMEEEVTAVVVKPYSHSQRPRLTEACRKNIQQNLEQRRLIGARIFILSPEYTGISIYAEIAAKAGKEAVRAEVKDALTRLFYELRAEFGAVIRYSAVYGCMDALDTVAGILSFGIDARGQNIRRSRNGDLLLPVNGLAYLGEWNVTIVTGR